MTKTQISICVVLIGFSIFAFLAAKQSHGDVTLILKYGFNNLPTHAANANCHWEKSSFPKSGISFFDQVCETSASSWRYSEDSEGRIVRKLDDDQRALFTMEVFEKSKSDDPASTMELLFAQLTPDERARCEIKNADRPRDEYQSESPHPVEHKVRYEIGPQKAILDEIFKKYDGVPSDKEYDYMCGSLFGSRLNAASPYVEFDDRSPGKYLLVGSLGNDGSIQIDLNSMSF